MMNIETMTDWTCDLLRAAGLSDSDAHTAADVIRRATERGVGHHDVYYLPQRLRLLTEGTVNPSPNIRCLKEFGAMKVFDGDGGLGEVCVSGITREAVALARENGIGMASVRHSNHFLAASPYVEMALEAGCLAIVWSNTDPCMGGPEGNCDLIGNNPFGFAAPAGGDASMIFDIAMAYTSLGKLGSRIAAGETVPSHWGRNSEGSYTGDPREILDGGVCAPMGEHKGFGLAMMHEILTAGLTGGEMAGEVVPRGGWNRHSQTVLAIDMEAYGIHDSLGERVSSMVEGMAERDPSVRIPGARSLESRRAVRLGEWSPEPGLLQELSDWSERLGVPVPAGLNRDLKREECSDPV